MCDLETKSLLVVIFSSLGVVHQPLSLLVIFVCPPPLVTLSAALVVVVDSMGWWHYRRIAPLLNNNDGDLPFLLFFFQRRGLGRQGRLSTTHDLTQKDLGTPYFSSCLNDKKNNQKDK